MKSSFLSLFMILSILDCIVAQEKYSRIKIDLTQTDINTLTKMGLETDHGIYHPGVHFVHEMSSSELDLLRANNIKYYVLIDDVQEHYHTHHSSEEVRTILDCLEEMDSYEYITPQNYTYGSMGGYHTYSEMLAVLDSMKSKYPDLISEREKVSDINTWDGNKIFYLKISDNPMVDEDDEPELLYTALHHAREPNSLSQMIFYMWYLLENYDKDPIIKHIVDNTVMYFIPCINPDGYLHNELTDPNGGGFWRKNRRPAETELETGVDLNRNYGFMWGIDDVGSSPFLGDQTYRGPGPFSEPETQAVRAFLTDHNILLALNYHTFGNLLIHPWGFNDLPTDEDSLFKAIGKVISRENDFKLGTGTETVGYIVNGNSDDYFYGETTAKDKIYSYTPEVGYAFWPQEEDIDRLNKSCLWQNVSLALQSLTFYDFSVSNLLPDYTILEGEFDLNAVRSSFQGGKVAISLLASDPALLSFSQSEFEIELAQLEQWQQKIIFKIDETVDHIANLDFDVTMDYGVFSDKKSYTINYRDIISEVVWQEDFDDINNWDSDDGTWGLTNSLFYNPDFALTDSPLGNYLPSQFNAITTITKLDLTNADFAYLRYQALWDLEANYDYVLVQASEDGESWTSLCGRYTKPGLTSHGTSDPLYDGNSQGWRAEEVDLTDYIGKEISIRFLMVSDDFVELDGMYIDDLSVVIESVPLATKDLTNVYSVQAYMEGTTLMIKVDEASAVPNAELILYDMRGKLVDRFPVQSIVRKAIDLPRGMYVVVMSDGSKVLGRSPLFTN